MATYPYGPVDYALKMELRLGVWDLDLPERRWTSTSSREEVAVATTMCPCGTTTDIWTHIVEECEI